MQRKWIALQTIVFFVVLVLMIWAGTSESGLRPPFVAGIAFAFTALLFYFGNKLVAAFRRSSVMLRCIMVAAGVAPPALALIAIIRSEHMAEVPGFTTIAGLTAGIWLALFIPAAVGIAQRASNTMRLIMLTIFAGVTVSYALWIEAEAGVSSEVTPFAWGVGVFLGTVFAFGLPAFIEFQRRKPPQG